MMNSCLQSAVSFLSSPQEDSIRKLVEIDAQSIAETMSESCLKRLLADIRVLTHSGSVTNAIGHSLFTGLENMPTITSTLGVSLLTGANDVASFLADKLSASLGQHKGYRLIIPHAYAVASEVSSLVARTGIPMRDINGTMYYLFDASNNEPSLIRKALGSTIAMYSVAWIFQNGELQDPVLAIVPIFDGDGWALVGSASGAFNASSVTH